MSFHGITKIIISNNGNKYVVLWKSRQINIIIPAEEYSDDMLLDFVKRYALKPQMLSLLV